jgi:hypothetical protein
VANQVQIGGHRFTLSPLGIRVEKVGDFSSLPVSPVLSFKLTEAGHNPVPLRIVRLVQEAGGAVAFHGSVGQFIALDGTIEAVPELDAFVVSASLVNVTEQMRIRLAVHLGLPGEADPRWLAPGFFYLNNKPPGSRRLYPSYSDINLDQRKLVSTHWSFRSDRLATPLVCCWTYGCMGWIATEPIFGRSDDAPEGIGMSGLHFGAEDGQPTVGADFPYREFPAKFSFCHEDRTDPEETFAEVPLQTQFPVRFHFGFGAPDLHAYAPIIRHLHAEFTRSDQVLLHTPPEIAEHEAHVGLLRWHYDNRQVAIFESATFDRHFGRHGTYIERPYMHAGWLGGIFSAYTLLWAGRETKHEESVAAGLAVIDKFAKERAPCGTIFPVWAEEKGWSCSFGSEDGAAHSRTVAEGILFLLRAMALELRDGHSHPTWVSAALASLTYAMGAQREDGCLPAYYDLTTGRPVDYEGCGGLAWVAALATGSALLDQSYFREVAVKGGEYYATYVRNAFLYGSVEDQPCTPTCDDCWVALMAYIALYELEHDVKWLALARMAADLALTWRFTYNVAWDRNTVLHHHDFQTLGGDISSVACPVTGCTGLVAYQELMKLAAFTGDDHYRQRAEEARWFATQLVVTDDGMYNARAGMVAGQVFHTDWWQPKGIVLTLSQAIAATLVKHTALVSRKLAITPQTIAAAAEDAGHLPRVPVLYAEMAFLNTRESMEGVALGSLTGIMPPATPRGERRSHTPVPREEIRAGLDDTDSDVLPEMPVAPSLRERSSRGLSSENVPLPSFVSNEPIPYPAFQLVEDQSADAEQGEKPAPSEEEPEIKYKIF